MARFVTSKHKPPTHTDASSFAGGPIQRDLDLSLAFIRQRCTLVHAILGVRPPPGCCGKPWIPRIAWTSKTLH